MTTKTKLQALAADIRAGDFGPDPITNEMIADTLTAILAEFDERDGWIVEADIDEPNIGQYFAANGWEKGTRFLITPLSDTAIAAARESK